MARAACLATASEREGYGLVVVEAAARGTPSVVVSGSENATVELVREETNGAVAPNSAPESLAGALIRVIDAGSSLRTSTAEWFAANASSLQIDRSIELVLASYAQLTDGDSRRKGTNS
jgi:glycosyltransferase involved in cell wall biosynthesis